MGSRYTPHLSPSLHHSDISRRNAVVPAGFATIPVPLPVLVVAYVGFLYLVSRGRNSSIELRPLIPRYSVACHHKHAIPCLICLNYCMISDQECLGILGRQQTQTARRLNGYIKYVFLIGG